MNNAERIKQMTMKELAVFLAAVSYDSIAVNVCPEKCKGKDKCPLHEEGDCLFDDWQVVAMWLEQEAED